MNNYFNLEIISFINPILFLTCRLEQCYEAEFGNFPSAMVGEEFIHDLFLINMYVAQHPGCGVPLEHMLSYVPGVMLMEGQVKAVVWSQLQTETSMYACLYQSIFFFYWINLIIILTFVFFIYN